MDLRVLAAQLRAAFPDAAIRLPIRVLGEGFGSLVVETGNAVVFRIAKHAAAQQGHRRERRVLPVIQRHDPALRVPRVTHFLGASVAFPYGVIGCDKLPGRPLAPDDVDEENRAHIAGQVARFLTDLHGIDVAETVGAGLPEYPPSDERLVELWQNVSAYLARLVGVLDFENAWIGDPAIDLATQRYLGERFAHRVMDAYYGHGVPSDINGRVNDLMGLRELLGLEHGLMMGAVDEDALQKGKDAILVTSAFCQG